MQAAEAITDLPLRDIHLPEPVSWWPPAPGWWWLLGALLLLVIATVIYLRYRARRKLLDSLQQQLDMIRRQHRDAGDARAGVEQVSVLLRRACLSFFPRRKVAGLTGQHWLDFLNEHGGAFDERSAELLTVAHYAGGNDITRDDVEYLLDIVQRQLPRLHRHAERRA